LRGISGSSGWGSRSGLRWWFRVKAVSILKYGKAITLGFGLLSLSSLFVFGFTRQIPSPLRSLADGQLILSIFQELTLNLIVAIFLGRFLAFLLRQFLAAPTVVPKRMPYRWMRRFFLLRRHARRQEAVISVTFSLFLFSLAISGSQNDLFRFLLVNAVNIFFIYFGVSLVLFRRFFITKRNISVFLAYRIFNAGVVAVVFFLSFFPKFDTSRLI
jgi:hypothetical protein